MIELDLTPEQQKALKPIFDQARAENTKGLRGVVIAQVGYPRWGAMRVEFIESRYAKPIVAALTQRLARLMGATGVGDALRAKDAEPEHSPSYPDAQAGGAPHA